MTAKHIYNKKEYTLTNEGLKEGEEVFPISNGIVTDNGYQHQSFDYRSFMSGFPSEPHILLNLHYSDYKPYECHTSHGYGPIESYYKIISIALL